MNTRPTTGRPLSRRDALRLGAAASAAALLAACGASPSGSATSLPAPTVGGATTVPSTPPVPTGAVGPTAATGSATAGSTSTPAATGANALKVPNTGAKLPTDKVAFHWIDSGGIKATFERAYYTQYQQAHPNIAIQYDELPWEEIAKVVPLGVQNGNAPDVFQVPLNLTFAQAVQQGWARPLDDLIPNFAQWKAAFPPGIFYEGINVYNGKTYTFPFWGNKNTSLLLYNVDYLKQAGVDPQAKPMTWDEYRAAAKKLTRQGAGKYYGVILAGGQADRWASTVRSLAQRAGVAGGSGSSGGGLDISYKTGQFNYTTDQYLAAIDLLLGLKSDGSVFPGSLNLNDAQARAQFPQGVAGLIIEGIYNISIWKDQNPGFAFEVASQPAPNSGTPVPIAYDPGGAEYFWVYAKGKNPIIAADIFSYYGSEEGQTALLTMTKGARQSVFPKANQAASGEPRVQRANAIFDDQLRLGPSPAVRNPDVSKALLEQRPLTPNFGTVVQGIYTGQLSDPRKAMKDLHDRSDAELERAIKAAQAKGAKVTRDDWVFPNWDPTKDYTDADYAALKK
jgi:multiple sugar transport system substrate-binding protein